MMTENTTATGQRNSEETGIQSPAKRRHSNVGTRVTLLTKAGKHDAASEIVTCSDDVCVYIAKAKEPGPSKGATH